MGIGKSEQLPSRPFRVPADDPLLAALENAEGKALSSLDLPAHHEICQQLRSLGVAVRAKRLEMLSARRPVLQVISLLGRMEADAFQFATAFAADAFARP